MYKLLAFNAILTVAYMNKNVKRQSETLMLVGSIMLQTPLTFRRSFEQAPWLLFCLPDFWFSTQIG